MHSACQTFEIMFAVQLHPSDTHRNPQEWTISVWTLAPIDVGDHTYRDLVGVLVSAPTLVGFVGLKVGEADDDM